MSTDGWILLFLLLVLIIVIVVLIIVFDFVRSNGGQTGQTGVTGQTGMTGQTGQTGTSPCGNGTVFDQLCLLNGVVITLSNTVTGGLMGICQGDILNAPTNWCTDVGTLNFCSTSPNMPGSTSWQVLRSTNNQFIAFLNTATNEYLTTDQFWTSCFPCTYGYGCNNPVSTHETSLDPNNPSLNGFSWFTINIVDLGSGTIQLLPSNNIGYVGSDSSQMNSNSCLDMVSANYSVSDQATNWIINYLS